MTGQTGLSTELAATVMRVLCRVGRFMVFLCTAGWAFPHVCTEEMDLTRIQNEHTARKT
jgi:hypothetical protein